MTRNKILIRTTRKKNKNKKKTRLKTKSLTQIQTTMNTIIKPRIKKAHENKISYKDKKKAEPQKRIKKRQE